MKQKETMANKNCNEWSI